MPSIVETGAVVASVPFNGQWSPCIRWEGEQWAKKCGPLFVSEKEAAKYADEYRRLNLLDSDPANSSDQSQQK